MSFTPYSTEFAIESPIDGVAVRIALLQMPCITHSACIGVKLWCFLHHSSIQHAAVLGRHACPGLRLRQVEGGIALLRALLRMTCNRDLISVLLQSILSRVSCDGFCVQVSAG